MAAYEVLLLNTTLPQIQAAQSGDTYVVPRDITFSTNATFTTGTANGVMYLNGDKVVSTGSLLTFNGTTFTAPSLSLTNALSTTSGGTGLSSFTAGDLTYYSTGTALSKLAIGTANQVLTSSGTAPQWTSLSSIGVTSVSFGSTGLTPSSATAGAVSVAGTLVTSNGGTGLSSYTAGDLVYYSTGTALSKLAIGTASQILTSSGSAPQWSTASGISVGTATNLAGGAAGSVPYQSGAGATTFLSIGAANRVLTSTGSAPQWVTSLTGLTGVSSSSITNTGLTSGRVVYSTTGGAQTDSASLTFDGTTLTAGGFSGPLNGTVGATTANTGAFTTLSASSTVTLSGGTANGVLYLNGSKVATSGSALTFDGTNLGLSGTGSRFINLGSTSTNGQSAALQISAPNSDASANVYRVGTGLTADNEWVVYDVTNTQVVDKYIRGSSGFRAFYQNGSEQMRLTSTGLGIGTSNPGQLLTLSKATTPAISFVRGTGTATIGVDNGGSIAVGASAGDFIIRGTGTTGNTIIASSSGVINAFFSELGNLGLGVTPSAWFSTLKALQIGPRLGIYDTGTTGAFVYNAYVNTSGNFIYSQTAAASAYDTSSGQHRWYNAPSGTAGNAITFTQAMTLDASGNLGIVTTSPGSFDASADNLVVGTTSGNNGITIAAGTTGGSTINFADGTAGGAQYAGYIDYQHSGDYMRFGTNGGTERARITSAGDLLVGTTSNNGLAGVFGALIGSTSRTYAGLALETSGRNYVIFTGNAGPYNNGLIFYDNTAPAERARIDTSGNLLVGDTSTAAGERLRVVGSVGNHVCRFVNTKGTTLIYGPQIAYSAVSPNDTGNEFITCVDSTATRMTVRSNGGIANYSANDVNLSDRREKTNFAPAKSYLDTICAIPVQTFNYIDQSEDDPGLTLGVVAQDVQAVAPELVMESNWGTKEKPKMRLSIYQTDLQYALMKCIQEQQTIIQSLTARIAALESKGV